MRGTLALLIITTFVCITLSLPLFLSSPLAVNTVPEVDKAIRDANENLVDAFTAVVTAEKSGADVTVLTADLNKALGLLKESRGGYEKGDYSLAIACADNSTMLSKGIIQNARALRERAVQEGMFRGIVTIAGAILVIVAAYVLGYFGWRWWNQRSYKKLMEMRVKEVGVTNSG